MNLYIYIIIAVLLFSLLYLFNLLVRQSNKVNEAWADIDVLLKRRYNLIPSLISTVQTYAKHEKTTFEKLAEMRVSALSNSNAQQKIPLESSIGTSIKSILAIAEDYPKLQASGNFKKLQEELIETENTLSSARRYYNGTVRDFNNAIQIFPNNIAAFIFRFSKKDFFQLDNEDERKDIKIS